MKDKTGLARMILFFILFVLTIALSSHEYLNRFRSGFTLFPMMWTVKNDFDAAPFYLDRKAVRWVVSIRV